MVCLPGGGGGEIRRMKLKGGGDERCCVDTLSCRRRSIGLIISLCRNTIFTYNMGKALEDKYVMFEASMVHRNIRAVLIVSLFSYVQRIMYMQPKRPIR